MFEIYETVDVQDNLHLHWSMSNFNTVAQSMSLSQLRYSIKFSVT